MNETQVVKYNITDAAIAEMENLYMGLTIDDLDDKEQFNQVDSGRKVIKSKRVAVEKTRVGLKADALEWGRKVDSEAKRIVGKLEPIESHLKLEIKKVTDEQDRIKAEEEAKERAIIQGRIDELQEYGTVLPFVEVATWTDGEYFAKITIAKQEWVEEQDRLEAERLEREAEAKRLADQKADQDRIAKQQAEAQAAMDAEIAKADAVLKAERDKVEADRKALEAEKKAEQERKDREAFEAQAKIDAEAKAKVQEAERVEADRLVKVASEEAAERAELLKPDKEKLLKFADELALFVCPAVSSEEAKDLANAVLGKLAVCALWLKEESDKL